MAATGGAWPAVRISSKYACWFQTRTWSGTWSADAGTTEGTMKAIDIVATASRQIFRMGYPLIVPLADVVAAVLPLPPYAHGCSKAGFVNSGGRIRS
jgi:hypothetical protein